MTATAPAPGARAERGGMGGPGAVPEPQIAPPPKMRRRPAMIALSVACICVGGLASAWAWTATSNTNQVLTVRETVHRGEVITQEDLVPVQLGVDPAIQAVPAERIGEVVGRTAQLDIAAGSVIAEGQVSADGVPGPGRSVVGVSLTPGLLPENLVRPGDRVRVVTTANDPASGTSVGDTTTAVAGIVRGLNVDDVTGNTLANVEVSAGEAVRVASAAAAGNVALILENQAPADGATGDGEAEPAGTGESGAPEGDGPGSGDAGAGE